MAHAAEKEMALDVIMQRLVSAFGSFSSLIITYVHYNDIEPAVVHCTLFASRIY